jgi:hypothetical protein
MVLMPSCGNQVGCSVVLDFLTMLRRRDVILPITTASLLSFSQPVQPITKTL